MLLLLFSFLLLLSSLLLFIRLPFNCETVGQKRRKHDLEVDSIIIITITLTLTIIVNNNSNNHNSSIINNNNKQQVYIIEVCFSYNYHDYYNYYFRVA